MKKLITILSSLLIAAIVGVLLAKPAKKIADKLAEQRDLDRLAKEFGNLY